MIPPRVRELGTVAVQRLQIEIRKQEVSTKNKEVLRIGFYQQDFPSSRQSKFCLTWRPSKETRMAFEDPDSHANLNG